MSRLGHTNHSKPPLLPGLPSRHPTLNECAAAYLLYSADIEAVSSEAVIASHMKLFEHGVVAFQVNKRPLALWVTCGSHDILGLVQGT